MGKVIIFVCLFTGFWLLFYKIARLRVLERLYRHTQNSMEAATRQRLLANRSNLQRLHQENSLWYFLERELNYCGIKQIFPGVTVEMWLIGNLLLLTVVYVTLGILWNLRMATIFAALLIGAEWLLHMALKARMLRLVNRNLIKFLDFLGNYSVTAGEVTGVFNQISRYMEEPLKSVLDECYMEAQTTGDVGMALLSMADKIEHPKFKELVQNIEISSRYCADFKLLVTASRRSVREYLRMREEKKSLLREAFVNMALLLIMSGVVLVTVEHLIGIPIWQLLTRTLPGKSALFIVGFILFLFGRQVCRALG